MTSALLIQTRKEVRALLPWTIGVAIACIALADLAAHSAGFANFRHDQELYLTGFYALGVLAVAALSVGQELTHGTLLMLLAQPTNRHKVLGLKLGVLAVALVGLGALASGLFPHGDLPSDVAARRLLLWGPVAAGIGLVPLLTMFSGRPLGGVVFAVTIPGIIFAISQRFYPLHDGLQAFTITWSSTLIVSALGLGAVLFQFKRLEVAGHGPQRAGAAAAQIDLPLAGYHPTVQRSWIWLIVKKEFRLQQMTLAVSGLYVLAAVTVMMLAEGNQLYVGPTFGGVSMIHAFFIALIAGSLASAEERHMGSLAGQILQPRSVRAQWAIKAALTIGLSLTLAFGLSILLMAIHRPVDAFHVEYAFMLGIGMLTAASIYVSSISSNSLWALLVSLPTIGVAVLIGESGYLALQRAARAWIPMPPFDVDLWELLRKDVIGRAARRAAYSDLSSSLNVLQLGLIVSFGLLVLYFAARNHRTLDRNMRTIARQVLILGLAAAAFTTAYLVMARIAWSWVGY